MYEYIKGKIVEIQNDRIIIENNNRGYILNMSERSIASFIVSDNEVKIYTHMNVREDDISLYGFSGLDEKKMFLKLISVSKIGPKSAMAILSKTDPTEFAIAVITDDVKYLSTLPGIGKKTAARIILELQDKLEADEEYIVGDKKPYQDKEIILEAVSALKVLGYYQREIDSIIVEAAKNESKVENIIKNALKLLAK